MTDPLDPVDNSLQFEEVFTFPLVGDFRNQTQGQAIADFNRDGLLDMVLLVHTHPEGSAKGILLTRREPDDQQWVFEESVVAVFDPSTRHVPGGVASADFNADGWPDLVFKETGYADATPPERRVHVLLNNRDGSFSESWTGSHYTYGGLEVADWNGDDRPDILLGAQTPRGGQLFLLLNCADGHDFETSWTSPPYGSGWSNVIYRVRAGQFDDDPAVDIAAIELHSGRLTTFSGDGSGRQFVSNIPVFLGFRTFSLAGGHVNGDGLTDLVAHARWSQAEVFVTSPTGNLLPYWKSEDHGEAGVNAELADFDNDGYDDLFVGTFGDGVLRIYRNEPDGENGGFQLIWVGRLERPGPPSTLPGKGIVGRVADMDQDGHLDLLVGGEDFIQILRNVPKLVVELDIKPGSYPNSINPGSNGVIPVAILGNADFDVHEVDVETLAFGPRKAGPRHGLRDGWSYRARLEDVNVDGFTDLVSHYRTSETGIRCGDSEAALSGELAGGRLFEGKDEVRTVGCPPTVLP